MKPPKTLEELQHACHLMSHDIAPPPTTPAEAQAQMILSIAAHYLLALMATNSYEPWCPVTKFIKVQTIDHL